MKQTMALTVILLTLAFSSGCVSLSRSEQATLSELRSYGISETEVQIKHPPAAAVLNILPGFGNFYLAAGTNESEQWLFGILNFFTWPLSILWGVPEAAIDATTINKKETIYYYTFDPAGKQEYEKRKAGLDGGK